MLEETQDTEEIIQRVAALDIGKAELVCCVRVPGRGKRGRRLQEVQTYQTMTRALLVLADRLGELGVTRVVMEATSDSWKAPFSLPGGRRVRGLAGQRHRRQAPAGPAQDRPAGRGVAVQGRRAASCCAPASSHHPRSASYGTWPATGPIWWRRGPRRRTGWSRLPGGRPDQAAGGGLRPLRRLGRDRLAALIPGTRDPKALAQLTRGRMRAKRGVLEEAFCGHFSDHHGFLLAKMLARVDLPDRDIAELDRKLEELIAPFAHAVERPG
jgi:transposase